MESEQDPLPEQESPASPVNDSKDEDSNKDYFDAQDHGTVRTASQNENRRIFEFPSSERKSLDASLEGELDFEEEVHEKEELSKDMLFDECTTSKDDLDDKKYMDELEEGEENDGNSANGDEKSSSARESNEDQSPQAKKSGRSRTSSRRFKMAEGGAEIDYCKISLDELEEGEENDKHSMDGDEKSSSEKGSNEDNAEQRSVEEGEDDGEVSDDDDLEEGEVKDSGPAVKQPARQVCRFFNRGQCTWGTLCRFLHLSVNEKGHYNMFSPARAAPFAPGNAMGMGPPPGIGPGPGPVHLAQRRNGPDFLPPPLPPPPPPPAAEPSAGESSWERGLRHAKELMKKASRRKEQEPDFEEKRLNLSIDENDRVTSEYDKENEFYGKSPYRRQSEVPSFRYEEGNEGYDNGDREAREHWRGGRYENFEIRWTRPDGHKDRRDKDKMRNTRSSAEREKSSKNPRGKERWRDDRLSEIQTSRARGDEWRDPWRRSKTPKGRRSRSRGRSRGSYSSVSSHSYSDSYSRSSSRSSYYSSGSVSPSRPSQRKKPQPRKEVSPPPKVINRGIPFRRRPVPSPRRSRSGSYSRSHSSHSPSRSRSSTSRSHSASRSPSLSRSRSYSRSLSMSSVSSASSSITHSSSGSDSPRVRDSLVPALKKEEGKAAVSKTEIKYPPRYLDEAERVKEYDRMKEKEKLSSTEKANSSTSYPSRDKKPADDSISASNYTHPATEKVVKDPVKHSVHKQQIKLTLLSKGLSSKSASALKSDLEFTKAKLNEKEESIKSSSKPSTTGTKRPLSPTSASGKASGAPPPPKRSTSSRRDELLKQLKAVEDAIARKRAKFS